MKRSNETLIITESRTDLKPEALSHKHKPHATLAPSAINRYAHAHYT